MNEIKYRGELLTAFISICLLIFFYWSILVNINSVYFGASGDGLKNYYTILYYIIHGNSFWHFEGMNYPFGEHLVFTDAQPMIAWLLKLIVYVFPDLESKLLAFINSLMLSSIIIAAIYLFKIFSHFQVGGMYGALAACAISFFAPQLDRMTGHYALSYICFFPILYYYLIQFKHSQSFRSSIVIGLMMFFFGCIHLYYLILGGAFISLYILFMLCETKKKSLLLIHFSVQFIIPLSIIYGTIFLTDNVLDRPTMPYGFLYYRSRIEGIFLPMGTRLMDWINSNWITVGKFRFESTSYLGVFSSVTYIVWFVYWIKKRLRINKELLNYKELYLPALLLLLFSFGFPFILGLESLIEYLGPLKQFRAISRFGWHFYFVSNIAVFIWFINCVKNNQYSYIKFFLISLQILFVIEIVQKNSNLSTTIHNYNNLSENKSHYEHLDQSKYQALIPLPFFHVGSEWIHKSTADDILMKSFDISLSTGIPIFSSMLSRTSLMQSIAFLNIAQGNLNYLGSKYSIDLKPFLVVVDTTIVNQFNITELEIFKASKIKSYFDQYILMELNLDFFETPIKFEHHDSLIYDSGDVIFELFSPIELEFDSDETSMDIVFQLDIPEVINSQVNYKCVIRSNGIVKSSYSLDNFDEFYINRINYITYRKTVIVNNQNIELEIIPINKGLNYCQNIKKILIYMNN